MTRVDGTSARQLNLLAPKAPVRAARPAAGDLARRPAPGPARPNLRLLRRDVYAELARRRRKAQIAARHELDR